MMMTLKTAIKAACVLAVPIRFLITPAPLFVAAHESGGPVCTGSLLQEPAHAWHRLVPSRYDHLIRRGARAAHLPVRLVAAVMHVETHGEEHPARAVSAAGAVGPMQLMPATAYQLHVDPWIPRQNINGGARFLHQLIRRFHGNIREALVAYNAGPTAAAHGFAPERAYQYARSVLRYAHLPYSSINGERS